MLRQRHFTKLALSTTVNKSTRGLNGIISGRLTTYKGWVRGLDSDREALFRIKIHL